MDAWLSNVELVEIPILFYHLVSVVHSVVVIAEMEGMVPVGSRELDSTIFKLKGGCGDAEPLGVILVSPYLSSTSPQWKQLEIPPQLTSSYMALIGNSPANL